MDPHISRWRFLHAAGRLGAAILLWCLPAVGPAGAQVGISRDLFEDRLRRQGEAITFCINADGMMADFEKAVAREVAAAMLIEAKIREVRPITPTLPLDYRLPLSNDEIYMLMAQECDAFMGFTLARGGYPDWMAVTREYLTSPVVLVATDPSIRGLEDLSVDRPIAVRSLSATDNRLIAYLQSLPPGRQWQRRVYRDHRQALAALEAGTAGVALVWQTALNAATNGDPASAGLHEVSLPFATEPVRIGMAVRSVDAYLQSSLSETIGVLSDDGTMAKLQIRYRLAPQQDVGQ